MVMTLSLLPALKKLSISVRWASLRLAPRVITLPDFAAIPTCDAAVARIRTTRNNSAARMPLVRADDCAGRMPETLLGDYWLHDRTPGGTSNRVGESSKSAPERPKAPSS